MNTNTIATLEEVQGAINPEQRTIVAWLLDGSGSMEHLMDRVNSAMRGVGDRLRQHAVASKRAEILFMVFNQEVKVVQSFVSPDAFAFDDIVAGGGTHLGAAINRAMDLIEKRKAEYRQLGIAYTRPMLYVVSDGLSGDDVEAAGRRAREYQAKNKLALFAIGLEGADLDTLAKLCAPNRPPKTLASEDKLEELIDWTASASIGMAGSSPEDAQIPLPATDGWAKA